MKKRKVSAIVMLPRRVIQIIVDSFWIPTLLLDLFNNLLTLPMYLIQQLDQWPKLQTLTLVGFGHEKSQGQVSLSLPSGHNFLRFQNQNYLVRFRKRSDIQLRLLCKLEKSTNWHRLFWILCYCTWGGASRSNATRVPTSSKFEEGLRRPWNGLCSTLWLALQWKATDTSTVACYSANQTEAAGGTSICNTKPPPPASHSHCWKQVLRKHHGLASIFPQSQ